MKTHKLLIVDNCPAVRSFLLDVLASNYRITAVETGTDALQCLQKERYDMLISDVRMPGSTGRELISEVNEMGLGMVILAIATSEDSENAARLMRLGADDYVSKPFTGEKLLHRIGRSLQFAQLRRENRALTTQLAENEKIEKLLGNSDAMLRIKERIKLIAPTKTAVLISGENGTGKKLVASEIHNLSERKHSAFIKINCAAISGDLLEGQLFGQEGSALPLGAGPIRGKFDLAEGGTILLEEIGATGATVQAKLLRVLQEAEFDRLGGTIPVRVDARLIATTSRDLRPDIDGGDFREDLFYCLNVVPIEVPPLRERREDIPLLIDHYISRYAKANNKNRITLTREALRKLCNGFWNGNVRELQNQIERAVIMGNGEVLDEDFFCMEREDDGRMAKMKAAFRRGSIREMEKLMILSRLSDMNDNRTKAAKSLEISVRTLRNKLHEYNMKGKPAVPAASPSELEGELIPIPG